MPRSAAGYELAGFHEVVLSVSDIERSATVYEQVGGWERLHSGSLDTERLAWWGLPPEAAGREIVLRNPGAVTGQLRLLEFSGGVQERIRPTVQSWDTGAIFDFTVRVLDADSRLEALHRAVIPHGEAVVSSADNG